MPAPGTVLRIGSLRMRHWPLGTLFLPPAQGGRPPPASATPVTGLKDLLSDQPAACEGCGAPWTLCPRLVGEGRSGGCPEPLWEELLL